MFNRIVLTIKTQFRGLTVKGMMSTMWGNIMLTTPNMASRPIQIGSNTLLCLVKNPTILLSVVKKKT